MKKTFLSAALLCWLMLGSLSAGTVVFNGSPSLSWPDGTFSANLSGIVPDGFYEHNSDTTAYNGYGQNGEFILFNSPVELNSLNLIGGQSGGCCQEDPTTITVSLYNSSAVLLSSQTDSTPAVLEALSFNTPGVSKVVFDFTGGSDAYGDGRIVAWYLVSDVTYGAASTTPEPSSSVLIFTPLLLLGLGAVRRKFAS